MVKYRFTGHDITVEQGWRLTESSEQIYSVVGDFLTRLPSTDVVADDIAPAVDETITDFITQLEKSREDMQYYAILGAGIVIGLRKRDIPVRIEEISSLIRGVTDNEKVDKSRISEWKRKIDSYNGSYTPPVDATHFIERYGQEVGASTDVIDRAKEIREYADENKSHNSSVLAARCLWLAIEEHNADIKQEYLLEIADTTGPSIRGDIEDLKERM